MIVVISNSLDVTADYFCKKLEQSRIEYARIDSDIFIGHAQLSYKANQFTLRLDSYELRPELIQSIWYRRPKALKFSQGLWEAGEETHSVHEWTAALEGFLAHVPEHRWINHPRNNAAALLKIDQLMRAQRVGLIVPKTLVSQSFDEIVEFTRWCETGVIVKPISHGYLERDLPEKDTLIFTNEVELEHIIENGKLLGNCPTLFQEKIDKLCDIRINIVDEQVISVAIYASKFNESQKVDIRRDNMFNVRYEVILLPDSVKIKLLQMCKLYRLRFAAVDMALTLEGKWVFFEINPNGQWAWLEIEGVVDISSTLLYAMQSDSFKK
jgi:glutathione synthase/RimK-type ligase-like ATP-grasp enzyme